VLTLPGRLDRLEAAGVRGVTGGAKPGMGKVGLVVE